MITKERQTAVLDFLIEKAENDQYSMTVQAKITRECGDEDGAGKLTEAAIKTQKIVDGLIAEKKKIEEPVKG